VSHVGLSCLIQHRGKNISVIHGIYELVTPTHVNQALDAVYVFVIDKLLSCGSQLSKLRNVKWLSLFTVRRLSLLTVKRLSLFTEKSLGTTNFSHVDLICLNSTMWSDFPPFTVWRLSLFTVKSLGTENRMFWMYSICDCKQPEFGYRSGPIACG